MTEYLNEDCCDFLNDASASSFGWNFQSNAGIFLFLKYIKDAKSIKIESKLQDIEITLSTGGKVLAQAKSSQDYTVASDKKEKFKDALISLAKFSNSGEQFIYISNIPDTFSSAKDAFNNKVIPYSTCLKGTQSEIDSVIESLCKSIKDKININRSSGNVRKLEKVLDLIKSFDRSKLYISVISPYWGDDNNRYSEISSSILSFLVNDLKLDKDESIAIKQKLLEHWQLRFQHNSSQPDKNAQKRITKEEFAWPIAIYLTDDGVPDITECLTFVPDQALTREVSRLIADPMMVFHERFEFSNRVIQEFTSFRKCQSPGTRDVEKLFIKMCCANYYNEFKIDDDEDKTEYLTKAFVFKILINHRNMSRISAGIGVKP